ncbi:MULTISPECIES: IucA/IucC family protein [Marinobacter]|uniref:IucA/IucC family protein n=1 Tax=Marinobacter TaxID=2742 RepID=UPI00124931EC|nr:MULTISPECIES: IucA/IucC family protein [Marinobacter]MBL3555827.1 IucA/IucC family protein [Marinobacter sp. JB05H06]
MRLRKTVPLASPHPEQPADRVTRQLLEALLFERLVPWRSDKAQSGKWQTLFFRIGRLHCQCRGKVRGFGRIRLDTNTLIADDGKRRQTPTFSQLTAQLPAAPDVRAALLSELQQTVRFCCWNRDHLPSRRERRGMEFETLDAALDEGHPYHPCYKARTGFSLSDHQCYGPECGNRFRLHWLAVERNCTDLAIPVEEQAFWFEELGHEQAFLLRAAFNRTGADWSRFTAIPVHPWQWQHLRKSELEPALANRQVRDLGPLGDRYQPGQSLRSLFNVSRPGKATLKLPLAVGNTSSIRTLEPHSVPSAPAISRWLADTVTSDGRFAGNYRLELMAEYASTLFSGHQSLAGHLGCLWRESINGHLRHGEQALPLNALTAIEGDGSPLIAPWFERYEPQSWLARLLEVVILPVWHLLVAHGIGVEAHAQNTVLIHCDGWPVGIALRDFHDSVEYVESYLAPSTGQPDFGPRNTMYQNAADNRYYRMATPEALRELAMDTLFVYNLSELAGFCEDYFGLCEANFWKQVRTVLANYRRDHPELEARVDQLGATAPSILTESLMTRKLRGPAAPECHHRIANPLAGTCGKAAAVPLSPTQSVRA